MDNADLGDLIARIYDTVLEPETWPTLLLELAHRLGGSGAMIFEVATGYHGQTVLAPYYSENYVPKIVAGYLAKHQKIELEDQAMFAKHASSETEIELVDDTAFIANDKEFEMRPNVQDLMANGFKHRSGTLLNRDSWTIDRLAIQYKKDRGPSNDKDKAVGRLILPHVAKALRIGRPLIRENQVNNDLQQRLDTMEFGVCILARDEYPIMINPEFDRVIDSYGVFHLNRAGKLLLRAGLYLEKYRSLISSRSAHGNNGANPRRESIFFPLGDVGSGLFVEVCPISDHASLGKFPEGTILVTVLDATTAHVVDAELVSRFFPLSKTEQAVLQMIAKGLSNTQIAESRNRSTETVKTQIKAILQKTYTKNRVELVQLSLSLNSPFSTRWFN